MALPCSSPVPTETQHEPPGEPQEHHADNTDWTFDAGAQETTKVDALDLSILKDYLAQTKNLAMKDVIRLPESMLDMVKNMPLETQTQLGISILHGPDLSEGTWGFTFTDPQTAFEFFKNNAAQDPEDPFTRCILSPRCCLCGDRGLSLLHKHVQSVSVLWGSGLFYHEVCIGLCDRYLSNNKLSLGLERADLDQLTLDLAVPYYLGVQPILESRKVAILNAVAQATAHIRELESKAQAWPAAKQKWDADTLAYSIGMKRVEDYLNSIDPSNSQGSDEVGMPIPPTPQDPGPEPVYVQPVANPRLMVMFDALERRLFEVLDDEACRVWRDSPPLFGNVLGGFPLLLQFSLPSGCEAPDKAMVPSIHSFPDGLVGLMDQLVYPFGTPIIVCPVKQGRYTDSIAKENGTAAAGLIVVFDSEQSQLAAAAITSSNTLLAGADEWVAKYLVPRRETLNSGGLSVDKGYPVLLEDLVKPGNSGLLHPQLVVDASCGYAITMQGFLINTPSPENSRCYKEWTRTENLKPPVKPILVDNTNPQYTRKGAKSGGSAHKDSRSDASYSTYDRRSDDRSSSSTSSRRQDNYHPSDRKRYRS
jgi:hypothetical protein